MMQPLGSALQQREKKQSQRVTGTDAEPGCWTAATPPGKHSLTHSHTPGADPEGVGGWGSTNPDIHINPRRLKPILNDLFF